MGYFTVLAIVLACMGLFAMASFIITSRTKEIGIRKVNGATVSEIMQMLNVSFVKWIAVAFVIATPIAWYVMSIWLHGFAYRISLSWWIFVLTGIISYLIIMIDQEGGVGHGPVHAGLAAGVQQLEGVVPFRQPRKGGVGVQLGGFDILPVLGELQDRSWCAGRPRTGRRWPAARP